MAAGKIPVIRSFASWSLRAVVLLPLLFAAGCSSGDDDAQPSATASSPAAVATTSAPEATASATPVAGLPSPEPTAVPIEPDGERILEAVKILADTIGPRVAGSDTEKAAASLIGEWLEELGYDVDLQEFSIGTEIGRSSALSIEGTAQRTIPTLPFANSGAAAASGPLVDAGVGRPEDFGPEARGAIVLIERDGVLFFRDKVANAVAAGARAVIIYNNETSILLGSLETPVSVPVVGISQAEGRSLLEAIGGGEMTASVEVGSLSSATSYNVIARPPGQECETVTGGHYDSVVLGTGASDNASGTAAVLEIAAVLAHNGRMQAHCFVLFGAEELGLLGSAYYVSQLSAEEKDRLRAMLNFDMVGVGDEAWWLIGTAELQQRMTALAGELDINEVVPSTLIRGLNSDHAPFMQAGIPALMFHRWEDPLLHTPEDVTSRVNAGYLEEAARMGIALLESLGAGG